MKSKLRDVIGQYNPSSINIHDFWGVTEIAIDRAKRLDVNPAERWPNEIGSRVYIIMEKIRHQLIINYNYPMYSFAFIPCFNKCIRF